MAKEYYGLNRGETEFSVSVSTSTTSKAVELVVDLASSLTKEEVLLAIDMIGNQILKGNWPPA